MKKLITIVLFLILTISLTGCLGEKTKDNTQEISSNVSTTDYPAAIMVDDLIYLFSIEPMSAEVDETAIIGYTNSYTDTFPEENGQTNFNRELEMPYAEVEGGIAVLYENEWHLCTPKE